MGNWNQRKQNTYKGVNCVSNFVVWINVSRIELETDGLFVYCRPVPGPVLSLSVSVRVGPAHCMPGLTSLCRPSWFSPVWDTGRREGERVGHTFSSSTRFPWQVLATHPALWRCTALLAILWLDLGNMAPSFFFGQARDDNWALLWLTLGFSRLCWFLWPAYLSPVNIWACVLVSLPVTWQTLPETV